MNYFKYVLLSVVGAGALCACDRVDDAEETGNAVTQPNAVAIADTALGAIHPVRNDRRQVAHATDSGSADVAAAKILAMKEQAETRYELAMARTAGMMRIDQEVCAGLTVEQQHACHIQAKADYEAEKYQALAIRDAAKSNAAALAR